MQYNHYTVLQMKSCKTKTQNIEQQKTRIFQTKQYQIEALMQHTSTVNPFDNKPRIIAFYVAT
jgi:hypothetical protein